MQGVGPGTVLGGRYALGSRVSEGRDLELWSGRDATLQRDVTLIIIGAGHHNSAGVLDAARRAAGVEDTRLIRILDVGTQDGSSFIVEEAMSGSESLATILLQGPLPADEARRIAGETARGLETAGMRGLHHLGLTPEHVLIAPDGAIRVSGVAVAAATDGSDEREPDAAKALRRDAVGLVAVLYAALTGRWPLDDGTSGIEPAPKVGGGVAAPSEIVAGVPDDLDALCRMTLNEGAGPLTPGVVAKRIAPWAREQVHRSGIDPTVVLRLPGPGDVENAPVTNHKKEPAAVAGAATTKAFETVLASASASASATAGAVGGKLSSLARTTAEKSARAGSGHGDDRTGWPVGLTPKDDFGPPLPLLPASTALPPSRSQSKLVIWVVAAFVTLALIVGYEGLVGIGDGNLGLSTPRRTVTATAPAVVVPAPPTPQATATAAGPIAILTATGFDPEGDQRESNTQAARVLDGNPATTWTSELYQSAQFGNIKKGVGLLLDLGQPTSVHQVTLDLAGGPVDVTVYAATSPDIQGATVIGTASAATGRVELTAPGAMPASQFVIVWFTSLAPHGRMFGASVAEVALS